jgi:hypothetical protein
MECGFFSTEQMISDKNNKLLLDDEVRLWQLPKNCDFERALERVEDKEDI